jgi:hypothetical protein
MAQFNSLQITDNLLPIILVRQEKLQIVTAENTWEAGDRIIYLVYTPQILVPSSSSITIDVSSELLSGEIKTEIDNEVSASISPETKLGVKSLEPQDFLLMAREILKNPEEM